MLAFPTRFLIRSVYPVSRSRLVIIAVCGIPCRLVFRLVVPSRSVVSFPVCLFRFRHWAFRSSSRPISSRYLRLVVLLPHSLCSSPFVALLVRSSGLRFLTHSVRLRLIPVRLRLVSVRRHHCHSRRRLCLAPVASLTSLVLSFSPSSPVIASLLPRWRCQLRSPRCPI